jgi:hypothetical protein
VLPVIALTRVSLAAAAATLILAGCGPSEEPPMPTPFSAGESSPTPMPPANPMSTPAIQPAEGVTAHTTSGELIAAGVSFTVAEGWEQQTPASSMRLAQYALPGSGGPAELTVFCFGPGQGGETQANIDRWVGQFINPENPHAPVQSEVTSAEYNGLRVTTVQAAGSYAPTPMGPFAPQQQPQAEAALFGLIVEGGPQGSVYVKVTGPQETIKEQTEALKAFARSARLTQ